MRIQLLAALLLANATFPAEAQVVDAERDSARARAIERLEIGTQLKLVAAGHEYFGALAGRNALDLTLDRYGRQFTVPRVEVQALWEPGGHATGDGFKIGAVVGGIAGGTLGWMLGGFMCESGCTSNQAYGAVVGTAAGGLAVGLVGALIGSAFQTWERRFP